MLTYALTDFLDDFSINQERRQAHNLWKSGSAVDSQHLSGEFIRRFLKSRFPFAAIALTTDAFVLTSASDDYSYEEVFNRQVAAIGKRGDVFLSIRSKPLSL